MKIADILKTLFDKYVPEDRQEQLKKKAVKMIRKEVEKQLKKRAEGIE